MNKMLERYMRWQKSPILFVCDVWELKMQPTKPGYEDNLKEDPWNWKAEWFGDCVNPTEDFSYRRWIWHEFEKGKHITWQQTAVMVAVQRYLRYQEDGNKVMLAKYKNFLTIKAGKGMGKSTLMSWMILWFLYCHKDALIPCTAPTRETLEDALWAEIGLWIKRMPEQIQDQYDWQTGKIVVNNGAKWYARARTGKKENPEALAGMHSDHMMTIADEASGVPDEIFKNALDTLTNEKPLFFMISNPVRLTGHFFRSHNEEKDQYVTYTFNTEESPVVSEDSLNEKIERNKNNGGRESDEYKTSVLGLFPSVDMIDEDGYIQMINKNDIKFANDSRFTGVRALGVDPAGGGSDEAVWVLRDREKAKIIHREKISTTVGIATKTLTLMDHYVVNPKNVFVDIVGIGAEVPTEILAISGKRVNGINVGLKDEIDEERFANMRAGSYRRLTDWLMGSGTLIKDSGWDELQRIYYRHEENGKLKVMGKKEMRKKKKLESPNVADALMLTFTKPLTAKRKSVKHYSPSGRYAPEWGI